MEISLDHQLNTGFIPRLCDYGFTTTREAVLVVPTSSFLSSLGVSSLSLCPACTEIFWDLKLHKETSEYVPKFMAMLKVGREKYPELFFDGAPKYLVASR